jgi:hypothetical protein
MHRFNGLDIELTRGDSLQFRVTVQGRELPEGTLALFTVKRRTRDEEAVIEKRLPLDNGVVVVGLPSADTDITPRTYYWDMRILIPLGDGTYEVRTPMEYAAFTILEVVGNV